MPVITFRKPEDGLDHYKHVLDLFSIFSDVVRNPDVSKNISDLTKQVNESLELSDKKKKELADAQEIIAQSKEFLEDFEMEKASHAKKVTEELTGLKHQHEAHQNNLAEFAKLKDLTKQQVDKLKVEAEEKLAAADAEYKLAQQLESQANQKLIDVENHKAEHLKAVAEFKKQSDEELAAHEARLTDHEDSLSQLEKDRDAFEQRMKKFASLMTEG